MHKNYVNKIKSITNTQISKNASSDICNCKKLFGKRCSRALSPNEVLVQTSGVESKILPENLRLYEDYLKLDKLLRYLGARPWITLNVSSSILKSVQALTGCQWGGNVKKNSLQFIEKKSDILTETKLAHDYF